MRAPPVGKSEATPTETTWKTPEIIEIVKEANRRPSSEANAGKWWWWCPPPTPLPSRTVSVGSTHFHSFALSIPKAEFEMDVFYYSYSYLDSSTYAGDVGEEERQPKRRWTKRWGTWKKKKGRDGPGRWPTYAILPLHSQRLHKTIRGWRRPHCFPAAEDGRRLVKATAKGETKSYPLRKKRKKDLAERT